MNIQKIFNVATSSILLFTTGAPTVIAATDTDFSISTEKISNNEIPLVEILELSTNDLSYDILRNLTIQITEDLILLKGHVNDTYSIEIIDENLESYPLFNDKELIEIKLNKEDLLENEISLLIDDIKENRELVKVDLSEHLKA